jgi:anti-sigma factor RsiW
VSAFDRRCDDVLDVMTTYLEGHMPPDEHTRLETHIVYCPGCYRFMDQLRATVETLGGLPVEPIGAAERGELVEAFRAAATTAESP